MDEKEKTVDCITFNMSLTLTVKDIKKIQRASKGKAVNQLRDLIVSEIQKIDLDKIEK